MRKELLSRLAKIESVSGAGETNGYSIASALAAIVAFHVGEWQEAESVAVACARALGVQAGELRSGLHGAGRETLERMAGVAEEHACRRGTTVDALFDEITDALRTRLGLFPHFAYYFL